MTIPRTAWKVSKYAVFSGPYFPLPGLNTKIYEVNLRIQSEYRKIRTRNNSVFGHFSRSVNLFLFGLFLGVISYGSSHFREHKLKHNFQDILNSIYNCVKGIEISCYYLLHCSLYINERLVLENVIWGIDNDGVLELGDSHPVEVLFYEKKFLDISSNTNILNAITDFLLETKRFDESFLN